MSDNISQQNASFWDELCGTGLAKSLGVIDNSVSSLKKYDEWYFDIYPYLFEHIPFNDLSGKDVLEIGLGYGTVAQRIAESGARYTGMDIAAGPVGMVNHRLKQSGLDGKAVVESILEPSFPAESFDYVIAIGCLHHTGNLKLAIENCRKLLRKDGQLIFMVYSANSYRRWMNSFSTTLKYKLSEFSGNRGVVDLVNSTDRSLYDTNSEGLAAPHTDFISKRSLRSISSNFSSIECNYENIDSLTFPFIGTVISRDLLLKTFIPSLFGLDLYAKAVK